MVLTWRVRKALVLCGCWIVAARSWTAPAELWVAPDGDDADPGSRQKPFATLARARDAIRQMRTQGALLPGGVVVNVCGGVYPLARTLNFTTEDSGSAEAPVVYRACPGESVVLTGGKPIRAFESHRGAILRADVKAQGLGGVRFRLLVFNGKRQEMARYPNRDQRDPHGGVWAYVDGERFSMYADRPDEDGYLLQNRHLDFWQRNIPRYTRLLQMRPNDVRIWDRPEDGEVSIFPRFNWSHYLLPVESYDLGARTVHLGPGCFYEIRPGDRYFVRGLLEELDCPGEWYLDHRAGVLYFWPPEPLNGRPVYAPAIENAVTLTGCSHLVLQGFTIECCGGSGVVLRDCSQVVLAGNTIRNVGDADGAGVVVEGGHGNRVIGNDIYATGSTGIRLGGGDLYHLTPGGNCADNNYIHHVGLVGKGAQGIEVTGALNRVSHNLVHDTPHSGITIWGAGHIVEYNRIRHTCLESEDVGAIGGGAIDWLSWQGVVIRYNRIEDTVGYGYDWQAGRWRSPYFAHALYPDWAASGVTIVGNLLLRAPVSCLYLHSGRDNIIENNVLIEGGETQLTWTGWTTRTGFWSTMVDGWVRNYEAAIQSPAWRQVRTFKDPRHVPLADGLVMYGNRFRRNIVCYRRAQATLVQCRDVPLTKNEWDHNLFYHYGKPLRTGALRVKAAKGPNLLANPGLEEGPVGGFPARWSWGLKATENGRQEVVQDVSHNGVRSLLVQPGLLEPGQKSTAVGYVAPGPPAPFNPGQAYRFAVWLKTAGQPVPVSLEAYSWRENVHSWIVSETVLAKKAWHLYELVFRLPARRDPAYKQTMDTFSVRLAFAPGPGKFWVDDVSLKQVQTTSEWEAWQAMGMDRHSLVADPLFVAPDRDDYRLRPNSPAFRLGFRPLPLDRMGPYKSPLRASWPIVEAPGAREALGPPRNRGS